MTALLEYIDLLNRHSRGQGILGPREKFPSSPPLPPPPPPWAALSSREKDGCLFVSHCSGEQKHLNHIPQQQSNRYCRLVMFIRNINHKVQQSQGTPINPIAISLCVNQVSIYLPERAIASLNSSFMILSTSSTPVCP